MIDWTTIIISTCIFAAGLYIYMRFGRKNETVDNVLQWCWSFFEAGCKMVGDFIFTIIGGRR
jgi:hypothetical protein